MFSGQALVAPHDFKADDVLPAHAFDEITELRIHHPELIEKEARLRRKRRRLTRDGRLVLAALDHPARGVTKIRGDELAMGDRHELLARARRILSDTGLDGILASGDILEELFLLSAIERRKTHRSFLDERVLIGSMNRGGLEGAAFEMEDTFTALTAKRLRELRCDGGKMLYRLDALDPASGRTIFACSQALNDLRRWRLAAFLEPLSVVRKASGYETRRDAPSLVRSCGIAAALGTSSASMWLKLPYCEDFGRVCRATTLPILLLGGPARESVRETLGEFASGLAAGPRVRGAVIGRNLLFPAEGDPLGMCRALSRMVHQRIGLEEALKHAGA